MGAGRFFRKRNDQVTLPDQSVLINQIMFAIRTYLRVCGLQTLLQPQTLLVVRKNFDVFLMHGSDGLENPTNVIGLFPIQDAECFEEFKKFHADPVLRSGALGKLTLGHLAAQMAERIIQQLTAPSAQTAVPSVQAPTPEKRDTILLSMPATLEPK